MSQKLGYLVDLKGLQFDDGQPDSSWIQAFPVGKWNHPEYGEIDVTPELVKEYADGVAANVRGQDLDVDYDHKAKDGKAAGWIKQAEARDDGLYLHVDWTPDAAASIRKKEYRYFSPEFTDEWKNPATGVTHKNVLFGGGITNRPFLKGIMPINLTEAFSEGHKPDEGGKTVTPEKIKELAVKVGLTEDATEDQVLEALSEYDFTAAPNDAGDEGEGNAPELKVASDLKTLAESNPAIKQLVEMVSAQGKQLEQANTALQLAEAEATIVRLKEKAKEAGYAIPPVTTDAIRTQLLTQTDKKLSEATVKSVEAILDAKLVELKERGYSRHGDGGTGSNSATALADEVKKLTEGPAKMSYADALSQVTREQPELFTNYREDVLAGNLE